MIGGPGRALGELRRPAPDLRARRRRTRAGRRCAALASRLTVCSHTGQRKRYAPGTSSSRHTRTTRSWTCSFTSPQLGHSARMVAIRPASPLAACAVVSLGKRTRGHRRSAPGGTVTEGTRLPQRRQGCRVPPITFAHRGGPRRPAREHAPGVPPRPRTRRPGPRVRRLARAATARSCSCTTRWQARDATPPGRPVERRRAARARRPAPRRSLRGAAAPTSSSRSTCTTPRPGGHVLEVAGRGGRPTTGCGCAAGSIDALVEPRDEGARRAARALDAPPGHRRLGGTPRGPARRARVWTREHAPHATGRQAWSGSSTASRCARSRGTCRRCATCARCSRWASTPSTRDHVDRMVATVAEWTA